MPIERSEKLSEEPSPAEIAESLKEILSPDMCKEIAVQDNVEEALGLAFTALIDADIDPEEYLKTKGLIT